jgi:hypothetical protein
MVLTHGGHHRRYRRPIELDALDQHPLGHVAPALCVTRSSTRSISALSSTLSVFSSGGRTTKTRSTLAGRGACAALIASLVRLRPRFLPGAVPSFLPATTDIRHPEASCRSRPFTARYGVEIVQPDANTRSTSRLPSLPALPAIEGPRGLDRQPDAPFPASVGQYLTARSRPHADAKAVCLLALPDVRLVGTLHLVSGPWIEPGHYRNGPGGRQGERSGPAVAPRLRRESAPRSPARRPRYRA